MPKLPANYVKAPSFDNPLRATAKPDAISERKLVLRLDAATWDALEATCERERSTPEALAQQALDQYLTKSERAAIAPRVVEPPRPSLRSQLIEQLQEQFVRRSWVQCLLTVRAIVRESRS